VNEQAQVGILLAGPGVLASLTFAPLVIAVFYSTKFGAAVEILRWICLGTMHQVISWPMGYVIAAKARRGLFVGCEVAWGVVSIGLAWLCIARFGLVGAGIAFFGSYVFHGVMLYIIVSRISGFRWSRSNVVTGLLSVSMVFIVFCGFYLLPLTYNVVIGSAATVINIVYSLRMLTSFLVLERIPASLRKFLTMLHLTPRSSTHLVEL
jgi:PST family polysaccharide transporter